MLGGVGSHLSHAVIPMATPNASHEANPVVALLAKTAPANTQTPASAIPIPMLIIHPPSVGMRLEVGAGLDSGY